MTAWNFMHHLVHFAGKRVEQMIVKPETVLVRPFVVCAILRGVTLDKHRYNSFIDLQASFYVLRNPSRDTSAIWKSAC